MQRVTFSATAIAPTVDQNALAKAIDQGQKVIAPLKVEQFTSANLELTNDKVEIRFSILTEPEQPEGPEVEAMDAEALSAEVEGAE